MKNRKRNRLKGYNYSQNNLYFITSCVQNMECCFGCVMHVGTGRDLSVHDPEINNHEINNHEINNLSINNHEINNPEIKECKMILNKFGIIANNQLQWLENQYPYIIIHAQIVMPNHIHAVIEIDSNALKIDGGNFQTDANTKIKSLSQIIGAFKTTSSKLIHQENFVDFAWQRSFHNHIIRDEKSYLNIVNYIEKNPNKWFQDKFFVKD